MYLHYNKLNNKMSDSYHGFNCVFKKGSCVAPPCRIQKLLCLLMTGAYFLNVLIYIPSPMEIGCTWHVFKCSKVNFFLTSNNILLTDTHLFNYYTRRQTLHHQHHIFQLILVCLFVLNKT